MKFRYLFVWDSSDGVSSVLAAGSHGESSLSGAVSFQLGGSSRLLTVGRTVVQEVGCHFPFTFDLNHTAALQHVAFAWKHLVEVCSHLQTGRWQYKFAGDATQFIYDRRCMRPSKMQTKSNYENNNNDNNGNDN